MLDLHPQPHEYRTVDVRLDAEIRRAGRLYREAFFIDDIHAARAALDASVARGLFRREQETEFDYVEHYDSVDSWMECLAKPRVGALVADDTLIASACAAMPEGRGEIIVTQLERAALFTRSTRDG